MTAPDTIPGGQEYKCVINFDPIRYKNCLIELDMHGSKIPKMSQHEFVLQYTAVMLENEYELNVNITGCEKKEAFAIKHKFYIDYKKAKGRPATKKETEMIKASEEIYSSDKYKSFEEYILVNVKTAKIKSREKISLLYAIDKNNNVVFIDVTVGKISKDDKLILKKVVESCTDLKLQDPKKQDPYRRTLMPLDFSKLD
ncbi:MAG: hypothetical protein Q8L81_03955 [Bacteroidota bacterium]|nr:hypothetical protein [Bacteroidota bacterium]